MKSITLFLIVSIFALIGLLLSPSVFGAPNSQEPCSPNDIFAVLFSGLEKEHLQLPTTKFIFDEVQDNKIKRIIETEFPFPANKVSIGTFKGKFKRCSYVSALYDGFLMQYLSASESASSDDFLRWDGKLFSISFTLRLRNQHVLEETTTIFSQLNKLYGNYQWKEKYRTPGLGGPTKVNMGLNLYFWRTPTIIITYRSPYDPEENTTNVVVEYWDRLYYESRNYWELWE